MTFDEWHDLALAEVVSQNDVPGILADWKKEREEQLILIARMREVLENWSTMARLKPLEENFLKINLQQTQHILKNAKTVHPYYAFRDIEHAFVVAHFGPEAGAIWPIFIRELTGKEG